MDIQLLTRMDIQLLLAAGLSMALGGIELALRTVLRRSEPTKTYSEQLAALTQNLTQSTKQVDLILDELAHVAKEREATVQALEANLTNLEGREKHLQQQIEEL